MVTHGLRLGRPVNGFMHINGVTYKLGPQKDATAVTQLAMRLRAAQGTQHQLVILNGQSVELTIDLAEVWASATWIESDEPPASGPYRR